MKAIEWIKTWGVIIGLIIATFTFSFESCMTRKEIIARLDTVNIRLDQARDDRELIRSEINRIANQARDDRALIRADIIRIETKVEQLTQNYIEHLARHNERK